MHALSRTVCVLLHAAVHTHILNSLLSQPDSKFKLMRLTPPTFGRNEGVCHPVAGQPCPGASACLKVDCAHCPMCTVLLVLLGVMLLCLLSC